MISHSVHLNSCLLPGLWPSNLFALDAAQLDASLGFENAALDALSPDEWVLGGGDPRFGAFDLHQQVAAMVMQQMLLQLLVDYFACGMHARASSGSFGATPPWSGSPRPVSWRTPHAGGGDRHAQEAMSRMDGPRSRGQRGVPDGLRPNAANGARVVRELGFDGTIGGLGHRAGPSDHPHGNAIDVMTHGDTAMGHRVAEHFRQNHEQLGVKYVIYQQRIASPRTGWQWRPMRDRGNPTANHMDHPHISFR